MEGWDKMRRSLKRIEALPTEHMIPVTTVMSAGDYRLMLEKKIGIDDLIRMGIRMLSERPMLLGRIQELEETSQKQGKAISVLHQKHFESLERIETLEYDVKNIKDVLKMKMEEIKDGRLSNRGRNAEYATEITDHDF